MNRIRRAPKALIALSVAAAMMSPALFHLAAAADAPGSAQAGTQVVMGITQPESRHKLTFPAAGLILKKFVKKGDVVKAGDVLVQQDDFLEQKEMEKAQVEAESAAKVEAAEADYDAKKHIYEGKLKLYKNGGGNEQEMLDAKLDMILREKQIKVANDDLSEAKIKFLQEQKKVKDMKLVSPVDGIVEKVVLEVGEMADPQKPDAAVWVVKNDPLTIELRDLPSRQAGKLNKGDKLMVRYMDEESWQEAVVDFRDPVVDGASDTQLVTLALPNAKGRDSGLQIQVQLPANVAQAGEARDKTAAAGN